MAAREKKVFRKKKKFGVVVEFTPIERDMFPDEETLKKIEDELPHSRGITPQYLADKYNIRVSTAKKILSEAESKAIIKKVIGSRRTKVYTPADN